MSKTPVVIKTEEIIPEENRYLNPEPFLLWRYKFNKKSGKYELDSIRLSDESDLDDNKLTAALKRTTGATDPQVGKIILKKIARGLSADEVDTRLNEASALLPALKPQDESEAMLLGQFIALQDSGMKCLRQANLPGQSFYHEERLMILAQKLFNTANQTMLTLLKYRSGGRQTMQVIHVHNEGQAILAQNLVSKAGA